MAKHKNPLFVALEQGKSFTWTMPEGGDLASMRATLKHGQTLTMSPVRDIGEIRIGDVVLVRWHGGWIYHQVGDIQGDQFLITNSVGKVNGWVDGSAIFGRVSETIDPEPRPSLPDMLLRIEHVYRQLIAQEKLMDNDAQRLLAIVEDLRWYTGRLGPERSDTMPRANVWSFEQNLWRLMRQTESDAQRGLPINHFVDDGKICVGLAAKIMTLLEAAAT